MWRRLNEVPEEPLPWLIGIAWRVLANRRRAEWRAGALRERLARSSPPAPEIDTTGGDERVLTALASLGEQDRELSMLIAWEGLEHGEVDLVLYRTNDGGATWHRP